MMNKLKNSIIRFLIKRTCLDISTIYSVLGQSTEKDLSGRLKSTPLLGMKLNLFPAKWFATGQKKGLRERQEN